MSRYFITFIFLFATAIGTKGQQCPTADSLMRAGLYERAAVEYERCHFSATTAAASHYALSQKAQCYKLLANYERAGATLERCATTYDDFLQLALCQYLASQYTSCSQTALTAHLSFDTLTTDLLLLWTLSLNEQSLYDSAHAVALRLATLAHNDTLRDSVNLLYASTPRLLNTATAQWLSIVPGLGHLYAGYPLIGASTLILNAAIATFGLWQFLEHCYITAYLGGAGLFATTYPGAMRSAARHATRTNQQRTALFNNRCNKQIITLTTGTR